MFAWIFASVASLVAPVVMKPSSAQQSRSMQQLNSVGGTTRELIEFTASTLGKRRLIIGVPDWAARLQGLVLQQFPDPLFTLDNYYSLQAPSTCECNALLSFGVQPSELETVMTPLLSR